MAEKTIAEAIADAARDGIARVSVDGTTTELYGADDWIKLADYKKADDAKATNHLGLAFRTLKPGGCG